MDRDLEKRLDKLEAKLDKLTKLVEASADPRLITSAYGKEVLDQVKHGPKHPDPKFDPSKAPDRGSGKNPPATLPPRGEAPM